ncbi:MAG: poly-gamma-glutamate synthase PgsB [Chlamydiae bacterium]|nr:poly-gamma-glutamate synthase PgsB [Chlamydiota bacterium]MBI3266317.1 poly-gamma-glutamate synthase PgsB [Chlamydiota bacterium]
MAVVVILFALLVAYGSLEHLLHLRNRNAIPLRIHVNGTRGKSSVTRLIAGGLRAGGMRVLAKTTGTAPMVILEDGAESHIYRPGAANIIEQVKFFAKARERKAQAIVLECMALAPVLQELAESKMVRSHIGVITNARPDHLDVMGPTLMDVAEALSKTIPRKGKLFTAENQPEMMKQLEDGCRKKGSEIIFSSEGEVESEKMKGFGYIEHRENVALALKVCESCGVDRDTALTGMIQAIPDPGVLRIYQIHFFDKDIQFVNAFAANDPDSTTMIWNLVMKGIEPDRRKIVLVNARADRIQRSEQLGVLIARSLPADVSILAGDFTKAIQDEAIQLGLDEKRIENLGGQTVETLFEKVLDCTPERSIVFAVGNIGGMGQEIVDFFKHRGGSSDSGSYWAGPGFKPYLF